ncbi:class I adenylate-forming enzyme family protein [Rhodovulum sp. DZ06]|uniref:class I adenylate-forming enzyme family protein n=1 Tax=Rhodovulum sp. DZ06 TaxID=3425126 RepID=UPI003D350731
MQDTAQPVRIEAPVIADEILSDFSAALAAHAAATPDKPALIEGGTTLSWSEFGDALARVAGKLQAEGVRPGTQVASLAENSVEHVVLYCAVLRAGGCMVPLPYSAADAAITKMLSDSGAALLFASAPQMDRAATLGGPAPIAVETIENWAKDAAPIAPVPGAPDALFNIIYSSGTTGTPKGIQHDNRFRARQMQRMDRLGWHSGARALMSTPLYSNTTLVAALAALVQGGTLAIMPKFDAEAFLKTSEALKITHAMLVPVQYMRLMAHPEFDRYDLSSYERKYSTSAHLPAKVAADVMARWPGNLIEIYGMTEGGITCVLDCAAWPDKLHTVGRPPEGSEALVIDEAGNVLPQGAFGELVGRAPSMMTAYRNLPDKTAEMIWTDPEGGHWIRTGDMGRIDEDGFIELMDRRKDMIISGGFNIYAADLEAELVKHPDVAEAAVIAIPSDQWGETPLALVVPRAGANADPEAIRAAANENLGKTQRIAKVELRGSLPRSEIGKVLKRELRAPYWEGRD